MDFKPYPLVYCSHILSDIVFSDISYEFYLPILIATSHVPPYPKNSLWIIETFKIYYNFFQISLALSVSYVINTIPISPCSWNWTVCPFISRQEICDYRYYSKRTIFLKWNKVVLYFLKEVQTFLDKNTWKNFILCQNLWCFPSDETIFH